MAQNLNVKAWAASAGILWGVYLFLAPLLAIKGVNFMWFSNEMFQMLTTLYPGLTASGIGAVIGLVYGVICGAICGALFSWTHNKALSWF